MKRCPQCNRTYSDETLIYCLNDGSLLSAPYDANFTVRMARPTNPTATEVLPSQSVSGPPVRQSAALYILLAVAVAVDGRDAPDFGLYRQCL
jgi:hypothetical protein